MTTLRSGQVVVRDGSRSRIFSIEGGFADVTPESFTILAESAVEAVVQ
jgi:F-type H+-transporting ATPase subunit epsilon